MTVQLTLDTPGKLGHHCRTKCALSGYHSGDGNGFADGVCIDSIDGNGGGGGIGSEGAGLRAGGGEDDDREMLLLSCAAPSSLAVGGDTASSVVVDQPGGMEGYANDFVCVRGGTIRPVMIGTGLSGERCRLC